MQIIESYMPSSSLILNARGDAAFLLWAVELRQRRYRRAPYRRSACHSPGTDGRCQAAPDWGRLAPAAAPGRAVAVEARACTAAWWRCEKSVRGIETRTSRIL